MDSKYVDLHKIAAIFRGIQEEEYAKKEVDVADTMEDAVEEDNAFNTAAAKAALAGEKEFSFNGKKYPVKMSKEDAKKLMDDAVNSEEPVVEEPKEEDEETAEILKKGMEDKIADELEKASDKDEESTDESVTEDDSDKAVALKNWYQKWSKYRGMNDDPLPKGYIMSIVDTGITTDGIEAGEADKAIEVVYPGKGAEMKADMNKGDAQAYNVDWGDFEIQKHLPITNAMKDEFMSIMGDDDEETMYDAMDILEEIWNESVSEDSEMVAMDTNTLQQILNLAGLKPVTDADINQPEGEAEEVDEYSNSPEEEYADTDFMTNKLAGGVNRPKKFPNVGNQGHNDLVQRLTKAYNEHKED